MRHWIQTYTGLRVDPTDMQPDQIDIRDIAHALALTNRFTGHTPAPYSVAQHSCLVSSLLSTKRLALWGLLHDAGEAYLADISRPVKVAMIDNGVHFVKQVEASIMQAVCARFGLEEPEPAEVKVADDCALANEAYAFFGLTENYKLWHHRFENGYAKLDRLITAMPWQTAEHTFLRMFEGLTSKEVA